MSIVLYPIKALHTMPAIQGMAEQAARFQVMDDLLEDIKRTPQQAHNCAVVEFEAFRGRHKDIVLTDNVEALKRLYVGAYVKMYRECYDEVIAKLAKMAKQRKNCAD